MVASCERRRYLDITASSGAGTADHDAVGVAACERRGHKLVTVATEPVAGCRQQLELSTVADNVWTSASCVVSNTISF